MKRFEIRKSMTMGDLVIWMIDDDTDVGRVNYPLVTVHNVAGGPSPHVLAANIVDMFKNLKMLNMPSNWG